MELLAFFTLIVTGFVSCAEFGSYAFVHPVLRRLAQPERITVEQGLLKTFGRVMPLGMTLTLALAISFASNGATRPGDPCPGADGGALGEVASSPRGRLPTDTPCSQSLWGAHGHPACLDVMEVPS